MAELIRRSGEVHAHPERVIDSERKLGGSTTCFTTVCWRPMSSRLRFSMPGEYRRLGAN